MGKEHHYNTHLQWTGNLGEGTSNYRAYDRDHWLSAGDKPAIPGSSDPSFRGNPERYNPEELLVASLSSCHMLWYLHLCAVNGVIVIAYEDEAAGVLSEEENGSGRFSEVVLHPVVTVKEAGMREKAMALHHEANKFCFIANSVNFPVRHEPVVRIPTA
ncbi:MAG TPA: OsmC family protein [Puia sp.]|jgi:organic hydroperoxide reductase OsmC/OhrA